MLFLRREAVAPPSRSSIGTIRGAVPGKVQSGIRVRQHLDLLVRLTSRTMVARHGRQPQHRGWQSPWYGHMYAKARSAFPTKTCTRPRKYREVHKKRMANTRCIDQTTGAFECSYVPTPSRRSATRGLFQPRIQSLAKLLHLFLPTTTLDALTWLDECDTRCSSRRCTAGLCSSSV
jgi:hypothetical protein